LKDYANSVWKPLMKKTKKDPSTYNLAELLDDPDFIAWATAPNTRLDSYWEDLQVKHPHLSLMIDQAKRLIFSMRFDKEYMDGDTQLKLWEQISQRTVPQKREKLILSFWARSVAAAMLVFAIFGASFYLYHHRQIEIVSGFGQIREVVLPDSTIVLLNANSSVKYANNLGKEGARELWLAGEALFKVNHLHRHGKVKEEQLFLVHAGKVDIKVLGTVFNLNNRRDMVKLALLNGKVSMSVSGRTATALILKAGEQASFDRHANTVIREQGNIKAKIAWKDGMLIFDGLGARELFEQLEDLYGYHAVFKTTALKEKRISGTFSSHNYDHLLKGIELALGVSIKKHENPRQLIIR